LASDRRFRPSGTVSQCRKRRFFGIADKKSPAAKKNFAAGRSWLFGKSFRLTSFASPPFRVGCQRYSIYSEIYKNFPFNTNKIPWKRWNVKLKSRKFISQNMLRLNNILQLDFTLKESPYFGKRPVQWGFKRDSASAAREDSAAAEEGMAGQAGSISLTVRPFANF
jgi:hypothetical protein